MSFNSDTFRFIGNVIGVLHWDSVSVLGFNEESDGGSNTLVDADDCFEALKIFLADDGWESCEWAWFLECEPKLREKSNAFFFGKDKFELAFKLVSSTNVVTFDLLVRNPQGVRPAGQWNCVEELSWVEAWCTKDEGAAKDGKGVNWASFSNDEAVALKPDACRCSWIRSKSSLKFQAEHTEENKVNPIGKQQRTKNNSQRTTRLFRCKCKKAPGTWNGKWLE